MRSARCTRCVALSILFSSFLFPLSYLFLSLSLSLSRSSSLPPFTTARHWSHSRAALINANATVRNHNRTPLQIEALSCIAQRSATWVARALVRGEGAIDSVLVLERHACTFRADGSRVAGLEYEETPPAMMELGALCQRIRDAATAFLDAIVADATHGEVLGSLIRTVRRLSPHPPSSMPMPRKYTDVLTAQCVHASLHLAHPSCVGATQSSRRRYFRGRARVDGVDCYRRACRGERADVSGEFLLCTVTFYANLAHNLTRSP